MSLLIFPAGLSKFSTIFFKCVYSSLRMISYLNLRFFSFKLSSNSFRILLCWFNFSTNIIKSFNIPNNSTSFCLGAFLASYYKLLMSAFAHSITFAISYSMRFLSTVSRYDSINSYLSLPLGLGHLKTIWVCRFLTLVSHTLWWTPQAQTANTSSPGRLHRRKMIETFIIWII